MSFDPFFSFFSLLDYKFSFGFSEQKFSFDDPILATVIHTIVNRLRSMVTIRRLALYKASNKCHLYTVYYTVYYTHNLGEPLELADGASNSFEIGRLLPLGVIRQYR